MIDTCSRIGPQILFHVRSRKKIAIAAAVVFGVVVVCGFKGREIAINVEGEPNRSELLSVDTALETVRECCSDVLSDILDELKKRCPDIKARQSGGRSKRNDYRNYQWISVKSGGCEYLLCTHHNNLDMRTGNPHVQMGRIQFWRCEGPNGPHERDADGVWRYHFENEDATLPRTCIWDDDFSVAAVADRFLAFMERSGERSQGGGGPPSPVKARPSGRETAAPLADAFVPAAVQRGGGLQSAVNVRSGGRETAAPLANAAIETIRAVESKAMAAIVAELRRRHPDWSVRSSHGNSRVNDYRCYQWITIRPSGMDEAFWITMMFNDQDPYTGNTHTQFGRIQFWRGIVRGEYENGSGHKTELGPHTRDAGGWRFRSDKQWTSMPRLHLWSPEYSTAHVVDLFERFLAETKEVAK